MPTNTPNMNLLVPTIGTDSGLVWEQSVNANSNNLDAHNHTSGRGSQIPSAGLNIDTSLDMNNQLLINTQATVYSAVNSLSNTLATYVIGSDLYFNDGSSNVVRLTVGGAVNATSSGITSGTASAAFVGSVLVVNADTNKPADVQCGSVLLGNNVTSSNYCTLAPPAAMAASFGLTLPSIPASTSFITLDASGNMLGSIATSLGITGSNIAANTITGAKMVDHTIGLTQLDTTVLQWNRTIFTSNGTFTVPANVTRLFVEGAGGGGGGGGGAGSNIAGSLSGGGGAGGNGAIPQLIVDTVSPGDGITVIVGAGGAGGGGGSAAGDGVAGTDGSDSQFSSLFRFPGGKGGNAGTMGSIGGAVKSASWVQNPGGQGGQTGASSGSVGESSITGTGGAAGLRTSGNGSGGGGGAAGIGDGGAGGGTTSPTPTAGTAAAANSSAGGGGGGGRAFQTVSSSGSAGAAGGSGKVTVYWLGAP